MKLLTAEQISRAADLAAKHARERAELAGRHENERRALHMKQDAEARPAIVLVEPPADQKDTTTHAK